MDKPDDILSNVLKRASENITQSFIGNTDIRERVEYVCRQMSYRACARLLMACMVATIDRPDVDPRKPYTEIGDNDAFSGRSYDEKYITRFVHDHRLPLNPTTAFLTPAFRNLNRPLTLDLELIGRPRQIYKATLQLLDDVYQKRVSAEDLLTEIVRILLIIREEKEGRIRILLTGLSAEETLPLSSEEIINLIEQHLRCKNASRLPVLIVAAAYKSVGRKLGERMSPLHRHTAADKQTGSLGDIEVCLESDDHVVTVYEMKMKRVTIDDIDRAVQKVQSANHRIHNYIFITTEAISDDVRSRASQCYEETGGTEVVVLDCIGFLRHFLHFFHRSRIEFLNAYQELVLSEPDSVVSQPLKEVFLALRRAAEAGSE
jgi:hypothetical protein